MLRAEHEVELLRWLEDENRADRFGVAIVKVGVARSRPGALRFLMYPSRLRIDPLTEKANISPSPPETIPDASRLL
jgi:hypothetical protein